MACAFALVLGVQGAQAQESGGASSLIGEPAATDAESALWDSSQDEVLPSEYGQDAGLRVWGDADGGIPLAYAASDSLLREGDWEYNLTDEFGGTTAAVFDYLGDDVDVVFPSTLGGYEVSVIRTYGADFIDAVESVTIPSTVKEIGSRSFYGAVNLSDVNFASGCQVETFGEHCFEGCFGLTEFTMPASLKTCEDAPFYGCVNLKRLVFNDDVEPFLYTSLTISGNDTFEIARHFNPAPYAEDVEFVVPSSSKHYKVVDGSLMSKDGTILYAHPSTPAGGTLVVPGSVKVLGWMSLFSNEGIMHIELPSGLERIEDYALAYAGIDELIMPDSVVEVQGSICYECPNLKRVVISDSLKELGQQAGWNCFYGCENLDDVTLGSSLEVIGNGCFAYSKIESIHIPASVKQINYAAFAACSELSQVTGCTGLEQLNRMSFAQDGKLTSFPLDASDGYRYISSEAFSDTPYQPTKPSYMDVSDSGDFVVYDASLVFKGDVLYSEAYQVLDLVNSERSKEGLPALTMDQGLLAAANQRAAELCVLFDHTRPSGDDCFTVSDKAMGENIAAYQVDAEAVMDSWMNSSGHRSNIMSDRWSSIGIAAFKQNGAVYWVQLFGEDEAQTAAQPADVQGSYTVRVMDETCKLDMRVLYVDIEDGSNIYDDGLDVGERGRVGLAVVQNGRFARVSDSCISWSSSDSSVASIDGDGIVTAHKPGTATMTAKADKDSGFYMRTYDITVLQPSEPDPEPDPGTDPDGPGDTDPDDQPGIDPDPGTEPDQPDEPDSFANPFTDVFKDATDHYAHIMWLAQSGITTGFKNGDGTLRYEPYSTVKRCDMAAFLYRLAGSPAYEPAAADKARFSDVDGSTPHYEEVLWLASTGISKGWDNGDGTASFRPYEDIARVDMAAFLHRLADRMGAPDPAGAAKSFRDVPSSMPHASDVAWLSSAGITTGFPDGSFKPYDSIKRCDMAAMLHRLDGLAEGYEVA